MKKISIICSGWLHKLNARWMALTLKQQQKYIQLLFIVYLLLTTSVIINTWYAVIRSDPSIQVEHIAQPAFQKKTSNTVVLDTGNNILKFKIDEFR